MRLVEFIENRYQELTLKNQAKNKESFDILIDAEIKAAHEILTYYRTVMKTLCIPKIGYDFLMVNLGRQKPPKPVILDKLKKERADREKAKNVDNNVSPIQTLRGEDAPIA